MKKNQFDEEAGKYVINPGEERVHHSFSRGVKHLHSEYQQLLRRIVPVGNEVAVDIGGGAGEVAIFLENEFGKKSILTDISETGLQVSRSDKKALAPAEKQPIATGGAGVVHCKDVLVHIEDKGKLLKEIFRLLKKGGIAIITSQGARSNHFALYYDNEEEGKTIDISFEKKQDYLNYIEALKSGKSEVEIFGKKLIQSLKEKFEIEEDQEALSASPPYFKLDFTEFIQMAERIGFVLENVFDYRPNKKSGKEWTYSHEKVIVLRKP